MIQLGKESAAGEIAGCQHRGVGRFGDGYVGLAAGLLRNRLRDLMQRSIEPLQSVDAEDHRVGSGLLERRRESRGYLGQVERGAVNAGKHYPSALDLRLAVAGGTGLGGSASRSTPRRSW